MVVKECPVTCKIDWTKFHTELDWVMAHMIDEMDMLPSKTSLIELAEYTNAKKKLQEGKK